MKNRRQGRISDTSTRNDYLREISRSSLLFYHSIRRSAQLRVYHGVHGCHQALKLLLISSQANMGDIDSTSALTATFRPIKRVAFEWHRWTGHLGIERYIKLSELVFSVALFDRSSLQKLQCIPCLKERARHSSVPSSGFVSNRPLHLIHLDISGPIAPTIAGSR